MMRVIMLKKIKFWKKIKENKITNENMENYIYQKFYFQYMHDEYPNLAFNNIEYKIISQFNIKEIKYSLKDFNYYKR